MAKRSRRRNSSQTASSSSPSAKSVAPSADAEPVIKPCHARSPSTRDSFLLDRPLEVTAPEPTWHPSMGFWHNLRGLEPQAPRLGTFPMPSPTYSHIAPRSQVPSPRPTSRPPSPARSVISLVTVDSHDSGVVMDARSRAPSVVTSISIPASAVSPRVDPPIHPSISSASQPCLAPNPKRPSSLSSLSPKPKRHSQFYFIDDLITLNVSRSYNMLRRVS